MSQLQHVVLSLLAKPFMVLLLQLLAGSRQQALEYAALHQSAAFTQCYGTPLSADGSMIEGRCHFNVWHTVACASQVLGCVCLKPEILLPCQTTCHCHNSEHSCGAFISPEFAVRCATLCCRPASPAETRVQPSRHETPTSSHRGPSRRAPPLPPMLSGGGRLSGEDRKHLSRPVYGQSL